jgi:hypothetical protein
VKRLVWLAILAATVLTTAATATATPLDGGLLGNLLGGSCPYKGQQTFAPWNDYKWYYAVPNGGLENGSTGWSLGGASVASGNEPFYPTGTHSLSLPSGSRATSPVVCIGSSSLYIRMFGTDSGGTDSGLHVRVLWYGLLNQLLGATDYNTFAPANGWGPTSTVNSSGGFNLVLPLLGSTSARVQLTPLGSGSAWQIDDVQVDPWASKCC